MKGESARRKSIVHIQNVFLTSSVKIFVSRETGRYIIGYEPKIYRVHFLVFKIDKQLMNKPENPIKINTAVDLNVREEFRYNIKKSDPNSGIEGKNITVRIIPTRYGTISPLYATIFSFRWRKTQMGGVDEIEYEISECPTISNSTTINTVCYKKIGSQVSFGGTHGTHTYIVLSSERGRYRIGQWVKISNVSKSGRQYKYVDPITVSL